ncbi:MAG: hypothetical protein QCH96_04840 [Candidatus Thermoplasmatota archaeon]|nr:hypothetical protein [Candidatus Thermoplasmatota archaeon]
MKSMMMLPKRFQRISRMMLVAVAMIGIAGHGISPLSTDRSMALFVCSGLYGDEFMPDLA